MGVEGRGHATDEKLGTVADGQSVIAPSHRAIREQTVDPRVIDDGGMRIPAVQAGDLWQIHRHVAHDPLDEISAVAIVVGQQVALRRGQPAFRDTCEIVPHRHRVLHEAILRAADGAGAEADQRCCIVIRVALEIAMQAAGLQGDGEVVIRQREMIEADADIAGSDQRIGDGFGLPMSLGAVGKVSSAILR